MLNSNSDSTNKWSCMACSQDCTLVCRCVGATNKALAKRRAAEDALRIIAEKEAAVAAAEVAKQASQLQAAIGAPSIEKMATDTPAVPAEPPSEAAMLATPDRAE